MMQPLDNAQYDSVAAFLDAANGPARYAANETLRKSYVRGDCEYQGDASHWLGAGCKTGADVQRLCRDGWAHGRDRMAKLLDTIDTSNLVPMDMRRRLHRADFGDALDLAAVYAGRLSTAWTLARRRGAVAPRRVDIVANMICSGFENSDVLFWRGAAAIALADKLEAAGYMVRLVVGFAGANEAGQISCRITVKDHDRPLDIATISAVLLPGFFRALGHGWTEGHAAKKLVSPSMSVGEVKIEDGEIRLSHEVEDEGTARERIAKVIASLDYSAAAA